ncbi:MAG: S4 domain-containing protein, partial [Clostridium sp.]
MREIDIIAAAEDAGVRIDKYISEQEELSRSRVQSLLQEGLILVNEKPAKANYKVKAQDHITACFDDEMELEARPEPMELDVRYEDEDVIVINKPKNIVVHPAAGNQT